MRSDDALLDFILDYLPVCDGILMENFEHRALVLIIAIGAESDLPFARRLLATFRDERVELIADFLDPFSDGEG